jgi:hypothetical protein
MRYLSIILLLFTACQRERHGAYILTCRKQHSYIDVLGVTSKFATLYIDDSAKINYQNIEKPYTYSICLKCDDTLARISNRLYKAIQKQLGFYNCGYKDIMVDCLRNPRDTTYTWSSEIYTTIVVSNSIQNEVSSIDIIVTDSMYDRLLGSSPIILVTANETTYCDCPVSGYLILKPDPKQRMKEITVKHYRTAANDGHEK